MTFSSGNYLRSKLQNKRNRFSDEKRRRKTQLIRTNEIVLTMNLENAFHNKTRMSCTTEMTIKFIF